MDDLLPVVIVTFACLVALMTVLVFRRSRRMLEGWAGRNGYELLEARRRWVFRGPFWWRTSDQQMVYRIVVQDQAGQVRRGYARVGGWVFGVLTPKIAVKWDD